MVKNMIPLEHFGNGIALRFDGLVMFAAAERFGGQNVIEACAANTLDGFRACCWLAAEMTQAAARFAKNYEGRELATADENVFLGCTPADLPTLRRAVLEAILAGYGREIQDADTESDLGLAELEKNAERG